MFSRFVSKGHNATTDSSATSIDANADAAKLRTAVNQVSDGLSSGRRGLNASRTEIEELAAALRARATSTTRART